MELVLSAISAGGLVGASNQYLCLLLITIAAKLGWIGLAPQVGFMETWWFFAIVAVFWVLTVLPAYASLLSPGVMNAVNTVINALSGFVVPASAALLTLASVGIISAEHPELLDILRTLRIFDPSGERIGGLGWAMAGGAAATAALLTGAKFLAKPAVSTATGTAGTAAAPLYATLENVAAVVLMLLAYALTRINPWLLVALLGIVVLAVLAGLAWAVYQLWRMGRGIGRVIGLIETRPADGLSVVGEFLVWGTGWLVHRHWMRGSVRLALWLIWMAVVVFGIPALGGALALALAPVPVLEFVPVMVTVAAETLAVLAGVWAGARSAGALMRLLAPTTGRPSRAPAGAPAPVP
jgi:hypothetical protein